MFWKKQNFTFLVCLAIADLISTSASPTNQGTEVLM